jgi:hypothetical protein
VRGKDDPVRPEGGVPHRERNVCKVVAAAKVVGQVRPLVVPTRVRHRESTCDRQR